MTFYYLCNGHDTPYPDGYVSVTAPDRNIADTLIKHNFPDNGWYCILTEEDVKKLPPHEWAEQTCHKAIGIFIENKPSIVPMLIKRMRLQNGTFDLNEMINTKVPSKPMGSDDLCEWIGKPIWVVPVSADADWEPQWCICKKGQIWIINPFEVTVSASDKSPRTLYANEYSAEWIAFKNETPFTITTGKDV